MSLSRGVVGFELFIIDGNFDLAFFASYPAFLMDAQVSVFLCLILTPSRTHFFIYYKNNKMICT